jgi:hypothetical protein
MKGLVEFLNESLNKRKVEALLGQYNGDTVTIIGKPFTTDRDERYIMTMEFAKKNGIKIGKSLEDTYKELGEKAGDVEYWVAIVKDDDHKVYFVDFDNVTPEDEDEYKEYIKENRSNVNEGKDDVYAIIDFTDAIQGVFSTEEEATAALKDYPEEAQAKVKKMKKSEVEGK